MRIQGINHAVGGFAGVAGMSPGDGIVEQLTAVDAASVDAMKRRREETLSRKTEFQNFGSLLSKLQSTSDQMKMPSSFRKLAVDSSLPDVIKAEIAGHAEIGTYELEVAGIARSDKHLAFGFPDKDKTPVGFGFMRLSVGGEARDVTIEPGSTLRDVATKINDSVEGVRATIVNTGMTADPFRLMVSSIDSGEESLIEIDPDTTFTDFARQTKGQDLEMKFEGVDVKRASNSFADLVEGVNLKALKAAPGAPVTINVRHDVEKTSEGVAEFVKQYNEIQSFTRKQSQVDAGSGVAGILSGDGALRQASRSLQSSVSSGELWKVGITTNAKTGELQLDESKLKEALTKDYEGVVRIFAATEEGPGLASRMSDAIKSLQDRTSGAVATRVKGIEQRIKSQDQDIARKEERMAQRRAQIQRTFASLDARMAGMQAQGQMLAARFQSPPAPDTGGTVG